MCYVAEEIVENSDTNCHFPIGVLAFGACE